MKIKVLKGRGKDKQVKLMMDKLEASEIIRLLSVMLSKSGRYDDEIWLEIKE
jgi:hypothetical protein